MSVISHDAVIQTDAIVQPADLDDFAMAGPKGVMELTSYGAIPYMERFHVNKSKDYLIDMKKTS